MSTKIYNGYLLDSSIGNLKDIELISKKLQAFAEEKLVPIASGLLAKQIAIEAYRDMDAIAIERYGAGISVSGGIDISNAIEKATFRIHHRVDTSAERGLRDPAVDMRAIFTIFPMQDKTLAILFADNSDIIAAVDASGLFTEYAYWNNTDKPDDISQQEWDQRKKDWDLAIGETGRPNVNGYQVSLIHEGFFPALTDEEVIAVAPNLDDRIESFLHDAVFSRVLSMMSEEDLAKANRGRISLVINAMESFKSSDGYNDFIKQARQEIVDAINAVDVNGNRGRIAPSM
jgi:hypothetical protein